MHQFRTRSCPVGFRRAVGLVFDALCIFAIYYLPAHFLSHSSHFSFDSVSGSKGPELQNQWECFILGPVGLIFWRLACRFLMHTQTPGEYLSGFAVACKKDGVDSFCCHIFYGFVQSVVVYLAAILSLAAILLPLAAIVASGILAAPSSCFTCSPGLYRWFPFLELLMHVVWIISATWLIWLFYIPRSEDGAEAGIDAICAMKVVRRQSH